jgi:hypothetical protein
MVGRCLTRAFANDVFSTFPPPPGGWCVPLAKYLLTGGVLGPSLPACVRSCCAVLSPTALSLSLSLSLSLYLVCCLFVEEAFSLLEVDMVAIIGGGRVHTHHTSSSPGAMDVMVTFVLCVKSTFGDVVFVRTHGRWVGDTLAN